jgi:hypothetical protein
MPPTPEAELKAVPHLSTNLFQGAALKEMENDKLTGHGHHQCGRRKIKATVH